MNIVPDWSRRKDEIGKALRRISPLPAEADPAAYAAILGRIGIASSQDLAVLISLVQDAVMAARRDERPTAPLDTFLDWLMMKRL